MKLVTDVSLTALEMINVLTLGGKKSMEVFFKSDIGNVRSINQDDVCCKVLPGGIAFGVVCDGIGGSKGGEVASKMAVAEISKVIENGLKENFDFSNIKNFLMNCVCSVNGYIRDVAAKKEELAGMGTTVVLGVVHDNSLHIVHAGDSRAYFINPLGIKQLTYDHSVVQGMVGRGEITEEEAMTHPQKNIITKALGIEKDIDPEYSKFEFEKNNILMLCTDGLTNYLSGSDIFEVFGNCKTLEDFANALIDEAKRLGGKDNITVALISC